MFDERLQRRVKEPNRKYKKRKNDKVKFDRKLKERKIDYVNTFKRASHCAICGETSSCCLEFHHMNHGTKKLFTISSAICNIRVDMKLLKTEIRKCIILCSNCHKKLHSNDLNVELLPEILNK
jgi:hypothetical protein